MKIKSGLVLMMVLLGACATTPPFEGRSHANEKLKFDTMSIITNAVKAKGCSSIKKVETFISGEPTGPVGRQSVTEQWVAYGCQKFYDFKVTFTEDGAGGAFINVAVKP